MNDPQTPSTAAAEESPAQNRSWFARLKSGLSRSAHRLADGIGQTLRGRKLDEETLHALEEVLIAGDLGVATAERLTDSLRHTRLGQEVSDEDIRRLLADEITAILEPVAQPLVIDKIRKPHVILVVGVNGSGKTTTIGKLAKRYGEAGYTVLIAAADTFRAAASEQLQIWGERAHCPVIARGQGADPAGLVYDAMTAAKEKNADILLIDTAGRLHNKTDLMAELQKIIRVLRKLDETAPHTCLLVLDATTGQNAHSQVDIFREMAEISGIAVTKLDGSAKGGVVVALAEKFSLPIHMVGVGESADDLRAFEAAAFARGLLNIGEISAPENESR